MKNTDIGILIINMLLILIGIAFGIVIEKESSQHIHLIKKPLIPTQKITITNGISDTVYIYKYK